MAIRKIIYLPDPILRKVASPIEVFDKALLELIDDMFETMYAANGVGLAAPQIAISKQLAVIDATPDKTQRLVLVNPKIVHVEGEELMQEGCLSVPGAYDVVKRALKVTLQAKDGYGKDYELTADGLLAEVIQHEVDHLHGKLYVDHLSPLKRNRALNKLNKFKREQFKQAKSKSE